MNRDTLGGVAIAVSSSPGRAARSLLRLTGEGIFENLGKLLDGGAADALVTRQQRVSSTSLPLHEGRLPCLAIVLPGPGTFTGEDMIEFELPGNPALLASAETQLIDLLQAAGVDAHSAVAGEFTARAFLNGRISLMDAEYVAASIAARNHNELKAADHLRNNPLIKRAAMLIDSMRNILGRLEASIDFSDEADVVAITGTALGSEVQSVVDELDALLEGRLGGEAPQELPRVVLAGPPNAGKSTLFNRLLDRSRVVVSSSQVQPEMPPQSESLLVNATLSWLIRQASKSRYPQMGSMAQPKRQPTALSLGQASSCTAYPSMFPRIHSTCLLTPPSSPFELRQMCNRLCTARQMNSPSPQRVAKASLSWERRLPNSSQERRMKHSSPRRRCCLGTSENLLLHAMPLQKPSRSSTSSRRLLRNFFGRRWITLLL